MVRPIALLLAASLGLAILQTGANREKAAEVTVPCELLSTRHLAVIGTIDGRGPYRFIFDTGAPAVLLSRKVAKECGLFDPKRPKPERKTGSFPGQVILNSIQIGDAKATTVPATIADHPTVKAIEELVGPIDGIIGYPFFARFKTSVNYPARRIVFESSDYNPEDVVQGMMKAMFERANSKKPPIIGPAAFWGIECSKAAADSASGTVITSVFPGSPAAKSGLQVGDRILSIDGRWTDSVTDCFQATVGLQPGRQVQVVFNRGGKEQSLAVTPEKID